MKINLDTVVAATWRANERKETFVARALLVLSDRDQAKRLAARECAVCFYLDSMRLAGQAFTQWTCLGCEEPQTPWHNTAYPKLCATCSDELHLCQTCGADLSLQPRRKVERRKKR